MTFERLALDPSDASYANAYVTNQDGMAYLLSLAGCELDEGGLYYRGVHIDPTNVAKIASMTRSFARPYATVPEGLRQNRQACRYHRPPRRANARHRAAGPLEPRGLAHHRTGAPAASAEWAELPNNINSINSLIGLRLKVCPACSQPVSRQTLASRRHGCGVGHRQAVAPTGRSIWA